MSGKLHPALLPLLAAAALAAPALTVSDLVLTVRTALQSGRADKDLAKLVRRQSLAERMDDAVVETLESEGAGPATVEELVRLRELARGLPAGASAPALFDAPPEPTIEERERAIAAARDAALSYQGSLPNFLCTETVRRFVDAQGKESWKALDVLTVGVRYSPDGEEYKLLALNHKPTRMTLDEAGGTQSEGEFGSLLHRVFLPTSESNFRWERWGMLRRRVVYVFSYRIAEARAHYTMDYEYDGRSYRLTTAMRGRVYIDRETNQTLRILWEADALPEDCPIRRTPAILDYDYAEVGGGRFLLPLRAESRIVFTRGQNRNIIDFGDYRKFASEATITFEKR